MKNTMSDANYYLNNKLDQFKVAGDVLDLKSEIREINSFLSDLPKMTLLGINYRNSSFLMK